METRRWGMGSPRGAAWLLMLLLGLGVGATVRAGEDVGVEDFEEGIESLHGLIRKEKFEYGLRKLERLLEEHARRPYVFARRVELEDLAERLAFGAAVETPTPSEILGGDVSRYQERTGKLVCTYDADDHEGLVESQGGLLGFPARFTGPFEVEIRGRSYDSPDEAPAVVLFGGDPDPSPEDAQVWTIWSGLKRSSTAGTSTPAGIVRVKGSKREELAREDDPPISLGKPYLVMVRVSSRRIEAYANRTRIGRCDKPKDSWGWLQFRMYDWAQVRFSGEVDTVWMQNRFDALLQEQREAFRARWTVDQVLPAWLLEAPEPPVAAGTPDPLELLPDELDPRHQATLLRIFAQLANGNGKAARASVRELEKRGAPATTCAYLDAQVSAREGLYARGLREVENCLEHAPDFVGALLMKGVLLARIGREEEAEKVLLGLLDGTPRSPDVYETACLMLLMSGRPESAQEASRRAARAGVRSENLDRLARVVTKAIRGPTWGETHEFESRHYDVRSDIDKDTCVEAARLLEDALTAYRVNFEWVKDDRDVRYRVIIFSGRSGFLDYLNEISTFSGKIHEMAAGLYQPYLKQLVIWNLPRREDMLETIRHEGFHQYLDQLMPEPPTWLNEGLAVYHEAGEWKRGKLEFGQIREDHVTTLRKEGLVPLSEFLLWSPQEFYTSAPRSYAQAWAFVHMLREGESEHRELFKTLVEELQSDGAREVLERNFTDEIAGGLDEDLARYLDELQR